MTPATLSQSFSWVAIICSVLAAISTGMALHYRTLSAKMQAEEILRLKPRALSQSEKDKMIGRLKGSAGAVGFIYRLMDGEGHDYAAELGSVFEVAGWRVLSVAGNSLNDFPGYVVLAVSDSKLLPNLEIVRMALTDADIDVRLESIKEGTVGGALMPDRVWVIVGRKK